MRTIFINYRRDDTAGEARGLFTELEAILGKGSVFMDVDTIALGRDFRQVVGERLESCDLMLALVGRNWVDAKNPSGQRRLEDPNDFVRLEIAAALKRNIPVTPVLVQRAQMPTAEQLPEEIKDFAYRNGFELSHNRWESDVQEMIKRLGLSKQRDPLAIHDIETGRKPPSEVGTGLPIGQQQSRIPWPTIVGVSAVAIALASGGVFYYRTVVEENANAAAAQAEKEREAAQGPALPINPSEFKLKLQVRLSEAFGPVDKAPELKLAHRLPKDWLGTSLLEAGKPIEDRQFEYESPVFMPSKGERYLGYLHRTVREAVKGAPRWVQVCFERKVDTLTSDRIIRLRCEEGGTCQVAPDDFGWAQPCRSQVGALSLISFAYAGVGTAPEKSSWVVPSLETLRTLQGGAETRAFTEFALTSGPLLVLKEADRVTYSIRVNGAPIYIDGLPPEVYALPFNAEAGLKLEFGLENLDFSGKNAGYENIEVTLQFLQGDHLIKQAAVRLQYVALRSNSETQAIADQDLAVRWKATYHPGKHDDVYQIFLLATPSVKEAEKRKQRIDEARLSVGSLPILAVVRPPLGENQNFGVALGIRQSSGQVKFTFDDETSRRLCRGVIRLPAEAHVMDKSAFRRSVDGRRDSKPCRQF